MRPAPTLPPLRPAQVANLLDTLERTTSLLARESRALAESRPAVTTHTVDRLLQLATALRVGVMARQALIAIPAESLLDGASVLRDRRRPAPTPTTTSTATSTLEPAGPAMARAQRRWLRLPAS